MLKTELTVESKRDAASRVSAILRTLANEDRLLLLCHLSQSELSVGEIEEQLGIRQPTLSQQLGVLRNEGLVETRRDGKRIYYRISDPKLTQLLDTLFQLYCTEN